MLHRQRPVAWPLALSLATHVVLVLLWWRQAPAPAAPAAAQRAPMVWLRLTPSPAMQAAATVASSKAATAPARPRAAARPRARPKVVATAIAAAAPALAEPPPPTAAPPAAVTGVSFGAPRWSLPFGGANAGAVFGTRRQTPGTTPPPAVAAALKPEPSRTLREQLLQTLQAQLAGWSAPADLQPAQCRLATAPATGDALVPECDSLALAQALAERLPTLREALAALRGLGPDASRGVDAGDRAALVIAFADGRYRLTLSAH